MNLSTTENQLTQRVAAAVDGVTPGVVLRAYRRGELLCDCRSGDTSDFYDLASLTKLVFTQQALMQAFDQGRWTMDSRVADFLDGFPHGQLRRSWLTNVVDRRRGVFGRRLPGRVDDRPPLAL